MSADQCPICPVNSFCQASGEIEACPAHTTSSAGSTSKLNCLCNPGYVCTYKKAVRVNVTLPLTQAQFALVRDQFLQSVANAAGVDVSQVSIIGLTLLDPGRRRLMMQMEVIQIEDADLGKPRHTIDKLLDLDRRRLDEGIIMVHVHIEGGDKLYRLEPMLRRIPGVHRVRTRVRTSHKINIWRN